MKKFQTSAFIGTLALLAAQAGAVGFSTGASSGNWTYLNPSSAEVGIGTSSSTNPAEKLQIKGGNVVIDNTKAYKAFLSGNTSSTNVMSLGSNNALNLYGTKLNIMSNGNVGIGTTSPSAKLSVSGNAQVSGNLDVNSTINAIGTLNALGTFATFSQATFNGPTTHWEAVDIQNDLVVAGFLQSFGGMSVSGGLLHAFNDAQVEGDLTVFQNLDVIGFKSFVQAHPTDENKKIVYVAAEAGEALTLARGLAKTADGSVKIALPEDFALVTSDAVALTVQLTPKGAPVLLYVAADSKKEIEVKMKQADFEEFGDVSFSYFVQGVRDGFEGHQPIQDIDKAPVVSAKQKAVLARGEALMKRVQAKKKK